MLSKSKIRRRFFLLISRDDFTMKTLYNLIRRVSGPLIATIHKAQIINRLYAAEPTTIDENEEEEEVRNLFDTRSD